MLTAAKVRLDRDLLTLSDLRPDYDKSIYTDQELTELVRRVSAAICAAYVLEEDSVLERQFLHVPHSMVSLARFPGLILELKADGEILPPASYEIDEDMVRRLVDGRPWDWPAAKMEISYLEPIPEALQEAAITQFAAIHADKDLTGLCQAAVDLLAAAGYTEAAAPTELVPC